ncbi:cation transporter [Sulfurimonas sp. MAG313]|nr:cation diffusion facilitator family transporter [Sulfurimonas sp. MAG313]MDF1879797.1 cation transporter [Sulfurimonas sp. MAG313]
MRLEKKATIISSATATLLVVLKLFLGIASGSVAILASAIDSVLDLAVSLFNYFALHNSEKEPDETFNYGRGKIEALAAVIEGLIISASGVYILYSALQKLMNKHQPSYLQESIIVMLLSFTITGALVLYLNYIAKKTGSMVIRSDALHYKTDLYSNLAILFSLGIIHFTQFYMIDALLGIFIALYIMYSAYALIKDGILMLMDVAMPLEVVTKIKDIIEQDPSITSYHQLLTRASGSDAFVSVHLVFNISTSLFDAHRVCDTIENKIKMIDNKLNWNMVIHPDPYDDSSLNEMED